MSDGTSHSSTIEQLCAHLEFLGFKITPPSSEGDAWHHAEHTRRADMFFREFPEWLRLHYNHYLGVCPNDSAGNLVLQQLNDLNERTQIAKFFLSKPNKNEKINIDCVRIRANLPITYDRPLFGSLLDLWQKEAEMVWQVDRYPPQQQAAEDNADSDSEDNANWAEDQHDTE